jgi:hypothetical protein
MGAIADLSQLINTLTGGTGDRESLFWYRDARQGAAAGASTVAGQYTSLWNWNTSPGGQGAAPGGTARNPTRATAGALGQKNPGGGRQKYITGFSINGSVACSGVLVDRLADFSGLSGTSTSAQNTTSLSVSRYTGTESKGNQIFLEIYTIVGSTATTATVTYTNQDGTGSRTSQSVVFGGTGRREATRMILVPLQAGDTGVRSVESVTLAATTGTVGDFGVTIVRPLIPFSYPAAGVGCIIDCITQLPILPEVKTDACLMEIVYASTTTSPSDWGFISFVEA